MNRRIGIGLAMLAGASTLYGNDWFAGVDYPIISNMNAKMESQGYSIDNDFSYQPLVLKVGAGTQGGLNMDVFFSRAKADFDGVGKTDNPINEFGWDIRYELGTHAKGLYPFGQAGLSYGWQEVDNTAEITWDENTIRFIGFKIGVGVGYYFNDVVELLAGIDYKYWNWQDIEIRDIYGDSATIDYSSSGTQIYIGANFWF